MTHSSLPGARRWQGGRHKGIHLFAGKIPGNVFSSLSTHVWFSLLSLKTAQVNDSFIRIRVSQDFFTSERGTHVGRLPIETGDILNVSEQWEHRPQDPHFRRFAHAFGIMTRQSVLTPKGSLAMPPISDNIQTGFAAACGFVLIGCLTWFFSSRRKTFIRTFVPADEFREVARSLPRGEQFRRGMRAIGLLQMGLGALFAVIAMVAWLTS